MGNSSIERSIRCNVNDCTAAFAQSGALKIHTRIHTQERPFHCDFERCDYAATQLAHIKKHKKCNHTKEGIQRRKHKEERTAKFLTSQSIAYDRETHVNFKCALGDDREQDRAFIDFIIQRPDLHTVFLVEVDEFSHSSEGYQLSCECRRMADATTSLMMSQPDVQHWCWIRFNPDGFTTNGIKQKVPLKDRLAKLVQTLKTYVPTQTLEVKYLYYSTRQHNNTQIPIIFDMEGFPDSLKPHCSSL